MGLARIVEDGIGKPIARLDVTLGEAPEGGLALNLRCRTDVLPSGDAISHHTSRQHRPPIGQGTLLVSHT